MQKSTEERLANIESSITRLTKMQDCVFKALLILHKTFELFEKREEAFDSVVLSMKSAHRRMDRSLPFMVGSIGILGFIASMYFENSATMDFIIRVMLILIGIAALALFFYGLSQFHRARSEFQEIKMELTQKGEVVPGAREEKRTLDDELAQVEAEWKELVPDELISEVLQHK